MPLSQVKLSKTNLVVSCSASKNQYHKRWNTRKCGHHTSSFIRSITGQSAFYHQHILNRHAKIVDCDNQLLPVYDITIPGLNRAIVWRNAVPNANSARFRPNQITLFLPCGPRKNLELYGYFEFLSSKLLNYRSDLIY